MSTLRHWNGYENHRRRKPSVRRRKPPSRRRTFPSFDVQHNGLWLTRTRVIHNGLTPAYCPPIFWHNVTAMVLKMEIHKKPQRYLTQFPDNFVTVSWLAGQGQQELQRGPSRLCRGDLRIDKSRKTSERFWHFFVFYSDTTAPWWPFSFSHVNMFLRIDNMDI